MSVKIKEIKAVETYHLRHQVMWPSKPMEFVRLENDQEGLHFGLYKGLEIVSVVSLFIKDNHAQFRKFATKTEEQGNGYGTLLLKYLMKVIASQDIKKIWCNAREDKTLFYERFGMLKTSEKFVKSGINYVVMEKIVQI